VTGAMSGSEHKQSITVVDNLSVVETAKLGSNMVKTVCERMFMPKRFRRLSVAHPNYELQPVVVD